MLNIFIGFVIIYLSFLLMLLGFRFLFHQFELIKHISYRQLVKIANVSFAVAFLIFLMATIFVIPLNQTAAVKQIVLFGLFILAYFSVTIFAIYDQNKHLEQQNQSSNSTEEE